MRSLSMVVGSPHFMSARDKNMTPATALVSPSASTTVSRRKASVWETISRPKTFVLANALILECGPGLCHRQSSSYSCSYHQRCERRADQQRAPQLLHRHSIQHSTPRLSFDID